jgi:hypothetical protein
MVFKDENFNDGKNFPTIFDAYGATLPLTQGLLNYIQKSVNVFEDTLGRLLDEWRSKDAVLNGFTDEGTSFLASSLEEKGRALDLVTAEVVRRSVSKVSYEVRPEGGHSWPYRIATIGVFQRLIKEGKEAAGLLPVELGSALRMRIGFTVKRPENHAEESILKELRVIAAKFEGIVLLDIAIG